jgi:hypothetical protein
MKEEPLPDVDPKDIQKIGQLMEQREFVQKKGRELVEDSSVATTKQLIKSLKDGSVSGASIVEWEDEAGPLRVNVIDFLICEQLQAVDPSTGEVVRVSPDDIQDGSWRLLS